MAGGAGEPPGLVHVQAGHLSQVPGIPRPQSSTHTAGPGRIPRGI